MKSSTHINQSSDPVGYTYQSSDPEGYTYQSSDPKGYTYQSSDLEGYTYQLRNPKGHCACKASAQVWAWCEPLEADEHEWLAIEGTTVAGISRMKGEEAAADWRAGITTNTVGQRQLNQAREEREARTAIHTQNRAEERQGEFGFVL
ncbi:NBS-LRR type resistance protein [Cucumis melo var. makuwa]|uniref:NBS-LRR type resistance protein n=1 Tax=Cucumis melo var. makuwa TaxID=1194695 RepID=A0A5A7UZI2_CUCMM|nr:NBS-LRR type resistance protein [Cucumis melo var. makuwa]